MCFLINNNWCVDNRLLSRSCTPELETLSIKCRPYYLPREFSSLILTVVYIPPDAEAKAAITQLSTIVTTQENAHPDATVIIAGDFNHSNLKKGLPKFYQHVSCPTRKDKTLDHCYTTIKDAYTSMRRAPLGQSDHNMIHLVPLYKQSLKRTKPIIKTVPRWSESAIAELQDCFTCTNWDVFHDPDDIHGTTEVISDYITFCERYCVPRKTIVTHSAKKALKSRYAVTRNGPLNVE